MNSLAHKSSGSRPTQVMGRGRVVEENQERNGIFTIDRSIGNRLTKADLNQADLTGITLGVYDLGRRIGHGGMGLVYEATHRHLRRKVAIKFLHSDRGLNRELEARFLEEIRAVGCLQNDHIVQANDAGGIDGIQFLVTELLQGADLDSLVQKLGSATVPAALEIIRQACIGLSYAHQCGFVHRDIKPSNLFHTDKGQIKVLDFGLVRQTNSDSSLTSQGVFMGTLDYIAPEQAENASQADIRCDIYSLGCTLIYLLSGESPFPDRTHPLPMMKLRGHLIESPFWEQRIGRSVPKEVSNIVMRMVAKNPQERFTSCNEIIELLNPIASKESLEAWISGELTSVASQSRVGTTAAGMRWSSRVFKSYWPVSIVAAIAISVISIGYVFLGKPIFISDIEDHSLNSANAISLSRPENETGGASNRDAISDAISSETKKERDHSGIPDTGKAQTRNALATSVTIPVGRRIIHSESTKTKKSKIE